ncbi:MAG: hypothetical protein Q9159_000734 [Coniocarpon cinnabarinum]
MSASESQEGPDLDYRRTVTLDEIPPAGQALLTKYSGLAQDELLLHILSIRDRAFKISPYPCVGQVRFLGNVWPSTPYLETNYLPRLRQGATLLDVGCGLGQDIRFLVFAYGVNSSQLYGVDIQAGLMDLSYDLFRDRSTLKATFFATDLLDPAHDPTYSQLKGKLDLIHASQFFHCWDWAGQITVAKNVVALTRGPGSTISGTQVGSRDGATYAILKICANSGFHYRHSRNTWEKFWEQVGQETGTQWNVDYHEIHSSAVEASRSAWWAKNDPGMTMFWFSVTRI